MPCKQSLSESGRRMKPHRIIGENYLHRYHLIPRNPFFNVMLHRFVGSDDDRATHDHPWWSVSFLLKGCLLEDVERETPHGRKISWDFIPRFIPVFRKATHAHRLELLSDEAWTLFITGPVIRSWGFWCGDRWVHWRDFTDASGNGIGRGCD